MIISHRGRNTNFAENTILSFDNALSLGAEAIECDLRLTLDNQSIVYHDNNIILPNKKISISQTLYKDIIAIGHENLYDIVSLDQLFEYIETKKIPFFLEVKSSSKVLVGNIIKKIAEKNLWEQVYIIGFSFFIGTVVRLQSKYPRLRVIQLINIPFYSYLRKPAKSYGVFLGWFDEFFGSGWLFRTLIRVNRLTRLREFYEKNGFKVMAGVINRESGFKYFEQAGIVDVVTDNIANAVNYFKHK